MKNIMALVLASICSLASAEWINAGTSQDESYEVYIENTSIEVSGSIAKVLWMQNYLPASGTRKNRKWKSVQHISIYDCNAKTGRQASVAFYSNQMGAGEAGLSEVFGEEEFGPVLSGTVDEMVLKIACKSGGREGANSSQKTRSSTQTSNAKKLVKLFVAGPEEGNEAGATIYLDQTSFGGNLVKKKFVLVIDYPDPLAVEKNMMKSTVMRMEMNCGESLIRAVKIELMSEQLGAGHLIKAIDGDSWRTVPSNFYMLPDLVCKK
jgi:hypothetical protein